MRKYRVAVESTYTTLFEVEATDAYEAKERALDLAFHEGIGSAQPLVMRTVTTIDENDETLFYGL